MMFRVVLSKGVETQLPHYLMKEVVGEQGSEVVLLNYVFVLREIGVVGFQPQSQMV